jgi:UDP-N-acetylglucosamine--N-acetylmuramyl-(pentapeptide) pyrophosphoryl-undecaprenol N-acetylglucosamine transferase
MTTLKRIVFTGGGTVGHISPLLAVMEAVQKAEAIECHYVGQQSDLESPAITESNLQFEKHAIHAGKLNRFMTWKHFQEAAHMLMGFGEAYSLLKRLHPDLVFAKGGAVSIPMAFAAHALKIPIVCHETDVIPGLANRFVARYASLIFTAFPIASYPQIEASKARYVGQPVRSIFYTNYDGPIILAGREVHPELAIITVIGGSQGGHALNLLVQQSWNAVLEKSQIIHICGPRDAESLQAAVGGLPLSLRERLWVLPFVSQELPALFQRSTLVISRAGGTIAELAATKRPTILVPLPSAAQDHQRANAKVLQSADAAIVVDEATVTSIAFTEEILSLLADSKRREALSSSIAKFDHPKAAADMAKEMLILLS